MVSKPQCRSSLPEPDHGEDAPRESADRMLLRGAVVLIALVAVDGRYRRFPAGRDEETRPWSHENQSNADPALRTAEHILSGDARSNPQSS